MTFTALWQEAVEARSLLLFAFLILTTAAVHRFAPADKTRVRTALLFFLVHCALLPWATLVRLEGTDDRHIQVRLVMWFFEALAGIGLGITLVFQVLLPRVGLTPPRILRDVVGAVLLCIAGFLLLSRAGVEVAGLIATSAVVTGVIGLSLQDTLGNLIGGLMLQSDRSIQVGDWIRFGDAVGRVVDIHWRYTAIETRDWETLVIPNGQIAKTAILVYGKRVGAPRQHRRRLDFFVDARIAPTEVQRVTEAAIRGARMARVCAEPAPHCLYMEHRSDGTIRYQFRYWLGDIDVDDPIDSDVRVRVDFALRRLGAVPTILAQRLIVARETDLDAARLAHEHEDRTRVIENNGLFATLPDEDRRRLAEGLVFVPFTTGEVIARQGTPGDGLMLLERGRVSVRLTVPGGSAEREVAQLEDGDFFGELSLMTGEPRQASIVAVTDVRAWRLDRRVFHDVMRRRPALAEDVGSILARRRTELEAIREGLDDEAAASRMRDTKEHFVDRIRSFFGLDENG